MAGPMRTKVLPEVQPPRPPNSWILYRAHILKTLPPPGPGEPRRSQSEVSAMVSQMWRDESEATKAHYERLAEEAKEQHKIQFPGYRFKPQKKEEKVRIRELMKQQREEEKLAKKARRVGQSAEPTATRASRSFLMPGAPYYNPHTLYNPVGPSPPLSASSSPRDAIPSPIVLPSMVPALAPANEPVLKLPSPADTEATPKPTPSPSIVPPLPPLSLPTTLEALLNPPSGSSSGAGLSLIGSSIQADATQRHDAPWQPENPVSLADNLFPVMDPNPAQDGWDNTIFAPMPSQPSTSGSLLFSVPPDQLSWLQSDAQSFDGHGMPLAPLQQNDSVYRLDDFDPSILSLDPQSEVEVSLGSLPPFHDNNFFDSLFPVNNDFMSSLPQLDPDPSLFGMSSHDLTNMFFNLSETYPAEDASTSQPAADPPVPQQPAASSSSSSYTPPAGAAYSSNRRVGANWASSLYAREELLSRSPPVHAN